MWPAWECYLTACRDILKLDLPEFEKYAIWEECAIEGGFRIMHEEFCMVSDFPEFIKVDDRNLPHAEHGPSHRWRDGWELFHWHGVRIPGEWVTGKPPTAQEALKIDNMELRRAACEILGWQKILENLDAKVIDKNSNEQIGTLYEVDLPDSPKEKFLQYRCGTGRLFAHNVDPSCRTAQEAQNWIWQDDDYQPEIRT